MMTAPETGTLQERIRALSDEQAARACELLAGDTGGPETLVAYVIAGTGTTLDTARIREWLVDRLPLPAIPSHIVELPAVPRQANGKQDRARLEQLCREALATPTDCPVADGDEIELFVRGLWCGHLDEADDSGVVEFFRSGGSSLTAIRALNSLNTELSITVPLVTMFRYPRSDLFAAQLLAHAATQAVDPGELRARARQAYARLGAYAG